MQSLKLSISVLLILFLSSFTVFSAAVFEDDFETNKGWVTDPYGTDDASTGLWERANPSETSYGGTTYQLGTTHSGSYDLVTEGSAGSSAGNYDIDGGVTSIRSPSITLPAGGTITLSFYYYLAHYSNSSSDDFLRVKVVGSTTQLVFEELGAGNTDGAAWDYHSADISSFAGQNIYVLIEAADAGGGSLVEAGIDDVLIEATSTSFPPEVSDIPGQTIVEGASFTDTYLNNYVSDDDTPLSDLTWTAAGQVDLEVVILMGSPTTRIARITYPAGWTGSETITFTVRDPENNSDSDDATFTVNPQAVYYTLTTSTTGCPQGTITLNPAGPTYLEGTEVTCSADPSDYFINWSGGPINGSTSPVETVVMNADYSITANFQATCAPSAGTWESDDYGIYLDPQNANVGIGTTGSSPVYDLTVGGIINCAEIRADLGQALNITTPQGEIVCNNMIASYYNGGDFIGGAAKIDGPVYAREVIVTMDPFPDYVFSTGYNLKPLSEVEGYINKNKHLPGIPSADEVKEKGLSLGEMQAKLLEKIEEMTLYMIELKKENNELKERIEEIENK